MKTYQNINNKHKQNNEKVCKHKTIITDDEFKT